MNFLVALLLLNIAEAHSSCQNQGEKQFLIISKRDYTKLTSKPALLL
jgi:hypothetical protein